MTRPLLPARQLVYILLTILVSVLAVSAAGIIYTGYESHQSDLRWCELLNTLNQAYTTSPPQTETGRMVAKSIAHLHGSFGC